MRSCRIKYIGHKSITAFVVVYRMAMHSAKSHGARLNGTALWAFGGVVLCVCEAESTHCISFATNTFY